MDDVTDQTPTLPSALAGDGGALAGRYEVRARLGRGATKEVYLAYDTRLDREVAIAIVVGATTDAARERVAREAQVTGRLGDHPNVITVYDTGEYDGVPYLVLRAMHGGSLADRIAGGRRRPAETVAVGRQIALALAHAHAHDVVHRDVKPDNVWLTSDGLAALGDFGIAHRAGLARLTAEGVVLGTVRYLSPEQIRGRDVGPASDLYALGVTLYEMACGRPPFLADDPTHVLTQHLTAEPVPPSQLEPHVGVELEALILALLAKDAEQRPASASDVAAALSRISAPADGAGERPPRASVSETGARRLVTVLAAGADVDDPEALHAVFDRCASVIERHGGTVERFLGDAFVALFGSAESRDDDAVRAVRAAAQLRDDVPGLRLGIESGELFLTAGRHGETQVTGAAIAATVRLAERAASGDIRLGGAVVHTLGADVTVDPESGRLIESRLDQPALLRPAATPFLGRAREIDVLHEELARVHDERTCRLVTVVGAPGIGKSRLARQFLAAVGDETAVLAGRCLAYGEGTTYRALTDIVRGLGDDPAARIDELLAGDEHAIRGVKSAVGLSRAPVQIDETAWSLRRLLERIAAERPLVVAVEDIHWAEPALLDLLDHVATLAGGSPILLLCLARPDLLESRPQWAAPQPNRTLLMLDALGERHALKLAELLGAGATARRIAARAEGNPLFVEQLVAVDAGNDDGELPASIQAVLAARIDRLDADDRMLLQRAAVEGRTFHGGALATSMPASARHDLAKRLVALARKGLIGSDRPVFDGEDAFRFTHALIREAAYAGLPKQLRAELHGEIAGWLEGRHAAADEVVGYHLEQACLRRAELGHAGAQEQDLARRAADRLDVAARAALARGDPAAASGLLERAVELARFDEGVRASLQTELGASLLEAGRMTEATHVLDEAVAAAPDPRLRARARIERELVRLETDAGTTAAEIVADDALPLLAEARDVRGQSRAWALRAHAHWTAGRMQRSADAWREAAECARRAGNERERFVALWWSASAAMLGPTPVVEAIRRCEGYQAIVAASPVAVAWHLNALAVLHAMRGELELADRVIAEANETIGQLGGLDSAVSHHDAFVRLISGRPDLAEVTLRAGVERLAPLGGSGLLATTLAMLARAVYDQDRASEAGEICSRAAEMAAPDDIITQVMWRGVQSRVLAGEGRIAIGEGLVRDALELIAPTDLVSHHGDALLDLAAVLRLAARHDEAAATVRAALALYDAKGNATAASRARALLEE